MASNQVEDYNRKNRALEDAKKADANPKDIAKLQAAADAAKALTPGGKGGSWGILS